MRHWIRLQRAITAAVGEQRALLVPAGQYAVSVPLVIPCTDHGHHAPGGEPTSPIRVVGEGMRIARIFATTPMEAVLFFNSSANVPYVKWEPGLLLFVAFVCCLWWCLLRYMCNMCLRSGLRGFQLSFN